jgi:hypothetical protein
MKAPGGSFKLWGAAVIASGILGALMAWWVVPVVFWRAVVGGWGVAVVNSVAGRLINRRAVGATSGAFLGWGIGVNAFRMLTLIGFFAYILRSYPEERGSFFASVFTVFFILMLVEVWDLFQSQGKAGSGVERSDPDECG